jgi:hypothetical protein
MNEKQTKAIELLKLNQAYINLQHEVILKGDEAYLTFTNGKERYVYIITANGDIYYRKG